MNSVVEALLTTAKAEVEAVFGPLLQEHCMFVVPMTVSTAKSRRSVPAPKVKSVLLPSMVALFWKMRLGLQSVAPMIMLEFGTPMIPALNPKSW